MHACCSAFESTFSAGFSFRLQHLGASSDLLQYLCFNWHLICSRQPHWFPLTTSEMLLCTGRRRVHIKTSQPELSCPWEHLLFMEWVIRLSLLVACGLCFFSSFFSSSHPPSLTLGGCPAHPPPTPRPLPASQLRSIIVWHPRWSILGGKKRSTSQVIRTGICSPERVIRNCLFHIFALFSPWCSANTRLSVCVCVRGVYRHVREGVSFLWEDTLESWTMYRIIPKQISTIFHWKMYMHDLNNKI